MLEDPCERNEQTVNNVSTRAQVKQIKLSKQSRRVQASQAKHGKLEVSQGDCIANLLTESNQEDRIFIRL